MKLHRKSIVLGTSFLLVSLVVAVAQQVHGFQFQADEWFTECHTESHAGTAADCSVIGVFGGMSKDGESGSFAMAVELQIAQVAVVGTPYPVKVIIRVDKNRSVQCHGLRYCIVPSRDAETLIRELRAGSMILIDVFTNKGIFHSSMSTLGYRAGIAKILAQRYQ